MPNSLIRSFFAPVDYSYDFGSFIERPNRFIAMVKFNSKILRCHVPDPGRLKDLLVIDCKVLLRFSPKQATQKTDAALIGVYLPDKEIWVSLDSQLANRFIKNQWQKLPFFKDFDNIKPEFTFGSSRLDFLCSKGSTKTLVEVKTVTLITEGIGMFPDAPTKRGARHVLELVEAKNQGYASVVAFVVPRSDATVVKPNKSLDVDFYKAIKFAFEKEVKFLVFLCDFTPEGLLFEKLIPFKLE